MMKRIFGLLTLVVLAASAIAEENVEAPKSFASQVEEAWTRVEDQKADHADLLKRQARLSEEMDKHAVATVLAVLAADASGLVTSVSAEYDTMEEPGEVTVVVKEGGIMDDDLIGVRHTVELASNSRGHWRIVGYTVGELRRVHMKF